MTSISTAVFTQMASRSVPDLQSRIAQAQTEATTARFSDIGQSLGYQVSRTISFRQNIAEISAFQSANSIAAIRMEASQTSLNAILSDAKNFIDALITAKSGGSVQVLKSQAEAGLSSLVAMLNTNAGGGFVFAGVNTGTKPVSDYDTVPPSLAQQAVSTAFQASFGILPGDAAAADIASSDIESFLNTQFGALFGASAWSTNWSAASNSSFQNRISSSENISTSITANEAAFRQLASAYVRVSGLGIEAMNANAVSAVLGSALENVSRSIKDISQLQSTLGVSQRQVSITTERLTVQGRILDKEINSYESVDPYEAAARVSSLTTQLETAYAMTSRLSKLSLVNYL